MTYLSSGKVASCAHDPGHEFCSPTTDKQTSGDAEAAAMITYRPGDKTLSEPHPSSAVSTETGGEGVVTGGDIDWNCDMIRVDSKNDVCTLNAGTSPLQTDDSLAQENGEILSMAEIFEMLGSISASPPGELPGWAVCASNHVEDSYLDPFRSKSAPPKRKSSCPEQGRQSLQGCVTLSRAHRSAGPQERRATSRGDSNPVSGTEYFCKNNLNALQSQLQPIPYEFKHYRHSRQYIDQYREQYTYSKLKEKLEYKRVGAPPGPGGHQSAPIQQATKTTPTRCMSVCQQVSDQNRVMLATNSANYTMFSNPLVQTSDESRITGTGSVGGPGKRPQSAKVRVASPVTPIFQPYPNHPYHTHNRDGSLVAFSLTPHGGMDQGVTVSKVPVIKRTRPTIPSQRPMKAPPAGSGLTKPVIEASPSQMMLSISSNTMTVRSPVVMVTQSKPSSQ